MKISVYKKNYLSDNICLIVRVCVCKFCVHSIAVWLAHGTILRYSRLNIHKVEIRHSACLAFRQAKYYYSHEVIVVEEAS